MKTNIFRIFLPPILGLAAVILLLTLLQTPGAAAATDGYTTYYVAPSCGGVPTPCFTQIQSAIAAIDQPGEVIKVAQGVYTSPAHTYAVAIITKSLSLLGGYSTSDWVASLPETQITTIDGQDIHKSVVMNNRNISSTLAGFHITKGYANTLPGIPFPIGSQGAGVSLGNGSFIVRDNHIYDNHSGGMFGVGGGLSLIGSPTPGAVQIIRNRIEANTANYVGAGIYIWESSPLLLENTIIANTCVSECEGGGIYLLDEDPESSTQVTLVGNLFQSNVGRDGGAISAFFLNTLVMKNNLFIANTGLGNPAWHSGGGAIYLIGSKARLENNVFANNITGGKGGAIFFTSYLYPASMIHNTFIGNQSFDGAAITTVGGGLAMTNTIFSGHSIAITGSIDAGMTPLPIIVNGVLWHNTPSTILQPPGIPVTVTNQFTGDPAFAADGYHLTAASAAIDRGAPTSMLTDIDSEPRRTGKAPDLGADEFPKPTVDTRLQYISTTFSGLEGWLTLDVEARALDGHPLEIYSFQDAIQVNPALGSRLIDINFSQSLFTSPAYVLVQGWSGLLNQIQYIYSLQGGTPVTIGGPDWVRMVRMTIHFSQSTGNGAITWYPDITPPVYQAVANLDIEPYFLDVTGVELPIPETLQSFPLSPSTGPSNDLYLPLLVK